MSETGSYLRSPYMEFSKLRSAARYNLATSGVLNYPLAELPVRIEDLEINGSNAYGYGPLLDKLAAKNGVDPACVVTATGTSMANHLAMAATLEPGDEVLIENPTYELLLSTASYLGARIRRFQRRSEDGFRIDPKEVRQKITPKTRLIVLTNLHNPSGVFSDEQALSQIGELANKVGARVLVDEVYLEMLFDRRVRSAVHLGKQFLITSSLTKGYGLSGLRCGWILCEPYLAERIWRINDLFGATLPYPVELLSVIALDNLESIGRRAGSLLGVNRKLLDDFLQARADIDTVFPRWGSIVFPRLNCESTDLFCRHLQERYETSAVPGRFFGMPKHIRIGIGGLTETVAAGLTNLGRALDEFANAHQGRHSGWNARAAKLSLK